MREFSSYSTTVLVMWYGAHIFIDMENFVPSRNRSPEMKLFTVVSPSKIGCLVGSVRISKIICLGAAISLEDETRNRLLSFAIVYMNAITKKLCNLFPQVFAWQTKFLYTLSVFSQLTHSLILDYYQCGY